MLTQVQYTHFRALRDVTIDLEPITVFVGPNGIGKSSALEGLQKLTWFFGEAWAHFWGDADTLLIEAILSERWFGPNTPTQPNLNTSGVCLSEANGQRFQWTATYNQGKPAHVRWSFEPHWTLGPQHITTLHTTDIDSDYLEPGAHITEWLELPFFAQRKPATYLRLDPARLAADTPAPTEAPRLRPDGAGLAAVLQHMIGQRDGAIERVEEGLRRLLPDFKRVHTPSAKIEQHVNETLEVNGRAYPNPVTREVGGFRLELEFEDVGRIPAADVSEGTLLALGLLAFVAQDAPGLVLMDDIDRGLHPAAQRELATLLRALIAHQPDTQLILTTHSPDMLDAFQPEEVRVFGRDGRGWTRVRALTDHPQAHKWLKAYRTGEFWSSVGEDWMAGGDGAPAGAAEG